MENTRSAAEELAEEVNAQIGKIAESVNARGGNDHDYTFFCECGCMKPVTLTLTAFSANGAFLPGHDKPHD